MKKKKTVEEERVVWIKELREDIENLEYERIDPYGTGITHYILRSDILSLLETR